MFTGQKSILQVPEKIREQRHTTIQTQRNISSKMFSCMEYVSISVASYNHGKKKKKNNLPLIPVVFNLTHA